MIAYLQGKIIDKGLDYLIVLVNDLGYKVHVTSQLASQYKIDKEIKLYTYQNVKEDDLSLFGFQKKEEFNPSLKNSTISKINYY